MDKHTYNPSEIRQEAEEINFTILINSCCRELTNCNLYQGIPKYDRVLSEYFERTGNDLHLKMSFPEDIEVYVPLLYASDSGRNCYAFPVVERHTATDVLKVIDTDRFLELVVAQARQTYPKAKAENILDRFQQSIDNTEKYLGHFQETRVEVNPSEMTFIQSEQRLAIGHSLHPLTKGRTGFSEEDLNTYSPEMGGRFQLHYFLIHPDQVTEESAEGKLFSEIFREELGPYLTAQKETVQLLEENPTWKVVPVHPWEAKYLLEQPIVKEMMTEKVIYDLGTWGADYTPTSSVRTVYNEESDWMLKFSLHVKITSAERVNHLHELYRGYDFARLMNTPLGQKIKTRHENVQIITDPGFVSVAYKGKVIEGFNTSIRYNPFKKTQAHGQVAVLASVFQDEVLGERSRIANIIEAAAQRKGHGPEDTAIAWFEKYTDLILGATIDIFDEFGIACELHQQNVLLAFDEDFFPAKVYFRDNQGFLFRETRKDALTSFLPHLAAHSKAFLPDKRLFDLLSHYFMVSNMTGLVNVLGRAGLAKEKVLFDILYDKVRAWKDRDKSGFVDYLLEQRYWKVKGNLLTALINVDGGEDPKSVVQVNYPNPLHLHFFSEQLIFPKDEETIYSRYFPKEDVIISVRPIDLEQDLEMLHEWFHRDHAKKIWQMDWSLKELETYYRVMLSSHALSSYIGEADGVPTCNFEVYWATRDMVGDYYEVLPTDYGTHQFIAPTDPKKKYVSPFTQCMVDYVFAQQEVGKMVGEGAVDSLASMMNKAHVGFKIEKVIEMPHKKANLNFGYREWYWAKFPQNKDIKISPFAERPTENIIQ